MPINSRRYQIFLLQKEHRAQEEHTNDNRASSNTGGSYRTIGGDDLVSKIRSGEINV